MLACELRLAGVDVLVLERLAEPSGESRAGGIHARTMEIFDMRGILEPFLAQGRRVPGAHFAGIPLSLSGPEEQYRAKFPFLLVILQRHVERLLEARATDLGVRVRRETAVTGLSQTAECVDIRTTRGDLSAEFLIGCDGGRSTVRKLAGIDFPGTAGTMTAILGDVELTDPPAEPVFQKRCPQGNYSVLGFEPGWYRVITNDFDAVADRDAPITVDDLRESLILLAGTDFGLHSPRWISRYNDAARLADRYRDGRILLAGDAAHIHYPAGGQGLNTGVQDAVNLSWKLAAVVRGEKDQTLLDTYEAERRPVAERVLTNTRAQTALTRPDPQTEALREVLALLTTMGDVATSLAAQVTALDIRYPSPEGAGHRIPDLGLPDGTTLHNHMHTPTRSCFAARRPLPSLRRIPTTRPPPRRSSASPPARLTRHPASLRARRRGRLGLRCRAGRAGPGVRARRGVRCRCDPRRRGDRAGDDRLRRARHVDPARRPRRLGGVLG